MLGGSRPTLKLHDSPFGGLSAAQDPSILVHEYTHGVTSSLVGGVLLSTPFAGHEAKALGEGYSDYFALTLLSFADRLTPPGRELRLFGSAFKPPSLRDYTNVPGVFDPREPDIYKLGMIWCVALLEARPAVAAIAGSADAADRVLWSAIVDSLMLMPAVCRDTGRLDFVHAKSALLSAARDIENAKPALAGLKPALDAALSARGI